MVPEKITYNLSIKLFRIKPDSGVDFRLLRLYPRRFEFKSKDGRETMKVKSSLKALKERHRDCKVVRRRGRVYVINKTDPRFKAKQG